MHAIQQVIIQQREQGGLVIKEMKTTTIENTIYDNNLSMNSADLD